MTKKTQNARETMEQMHAERDQMGDVTFLVESHRIRAHRSILATQSPKYKAQFYGPHRDEGEIRIANVSAAAFDVFLQFFYKESVDLTMNNIEMVLDLAKQSLVEKFVDCCVSFLQNAVKANKLCTPYRLANLYDIESLRLACKQRIRSNTKDIFASDDFLRCDRDMLSWIFKMDSLNCREKDVFAACIAWARAQCKRDNLDDEKPENLRTVLGDAIYQIRFSSFNAEEFAVLHKSMEGLFTADESIELFYIIGKLKDFKSQKFNQKPRMPRNESNGFSNASVPWSLEIDRRAVTKALSVKTEASGRFKFSFSCNIPIRLHGLGFHFRSEYFPKTLTVDIMDDDWQTRTAVVECKVLKNPTRGNENMTIFEEPIEQVVEFSCAIQLPFRQLHYEFDLIRSIRANNMVFIFHDGEWVTRLFFDKYDA